MLITKSIILFILAGLCEIGGGYLVWLWLRKGNSIWIGILGGVVLVLYGIIPTLQEFYSSDEDDNNSEEDDLEIPAFLRRQKN